MQRWYRRWLLRLIIRRAGASTELAAEFTTSRTSPLHRAVVAPSGILVINLLGFPLTGDITLNRSGDFVLRITLTDKLAKKTVKFEAPIKVTALDASR